MTITALLVPPGYGTLMLVEVEEVPAGLQRVLGGEPELFGRFELPAGPERVAQCWRLSPRAARRAGIQDRRLVIVDDYENTVLGPVVVVAENRGDGTISSVTDREIGHVASVVCAWSVLD